MPDPTDTQPVEQPEVPVEQPVEQQEELTPEEQALANPQEPEQPENPETPTQPEEERPPSRREQLRVQQLLKKYGPPPERVPSQKTPDFRSQIEADEPVYQQLESTAQQYGADLFNQGLQQADYTSWRRFLQMDEKQVRSQYDVLNPSKKDVYHPALEDALRGKYLRFIGYNPGDPARGIAPSVQNSDVSYYDFVESEMEFADEIASQRVANSTQNIAKQAANAGLRPDGSSAKPLNWQGKDPSVMSEAELKAGIAATMPRDSQGRFTSHS
jgi:hypothetical protein